MKYFLPQMKSNPFSDLLFQRLCSYQIWYILFNFQRAALLTERWYSEPFDIMPYQYSIVFEGLMQKDFL